MEIKPLIKKYHIIPFLSVNKYHNTLSDLARIEFSCNWKDFYTIEIGWFIWSMEFKIIS